MGYGSKALILLAACLVNESGLATDFQGLGALEGSGNQPYAMSADGSTVVGISYPTTGNNSVSGAFRWTASAGVQLLGSPADMARGVSADGLTIVGSAVASAFLWTESAGVQVLGFDDATGISADGTVVVGSTDNGPGSQPIFWTVAGGVSILPGIVGAPHNGGALGISADGSTIVGNIATGDDGGAMTFEAAAWIDGSEPILLGAGPTSNAHSVSADGSVIVGQYFINDQYRAFRWTQATGFQPLPELPGAVSHMSAYAVSGDGSTIIGTATSTATNESVAVIWDAEHGARRIKDILAGSGQATGWKLVEARGISADGRFVAGWGSNSSDHAESWIADLESSGPALSGFTLAASSVAGCKTLNGEVRLSEPAPAGGRDVTISDTLAAAFPPASVKIVEGATSKAFTIWTTAVPVVQLGTVSATLEGWTLSRELQVRPMGIKAITISPTTVVGSLMATGRAVLECKAGPGPITVDLSSGNAAVAYPVAASGAVPQGLTTLTFDVATNPVLAKRSVAITATANGTAKSRALTVDVAAAVSAKALRFGDVPVGTASATLSTTLRNRGAVSFAVDSIMLTGTNAKYYSQASNCPAVLAAGASCSIGVTFAPMVTGSKSAKLSIATGATSTPLSVSLSGTGI